MTYAEKLRDPRWQKKRLAILNRDEFTCSICGDKETELHVHHESYEGKEPWDTWDFLLTTLCKNCHELNHLMKTALEKFLLNCLRSRMKNNGEDIKQMNKVLRKIATGETNENGETLR